MYKILLFKQPTRQGKKCAAGHYPSPKGSSQQCETPRHEGFLYARFFRQVNHYYGKQVWCVELQGALLQATNPANLEARQAETKQKKQCRGLHAQSSPLLVTRLAWKRPRAASPCAGGGGNGVDQAGGLGGRGNKQVAKQRA